MAGFQPVYLYYGVLCVRPCVVCWLGCREILDILFFLRRVAHNHSLSGLLKTGPGTRLFFYPLGRRGSRVSYDTPLALIKPRRLVLKFCASLFAFLLWRLLFICLVQAPVDAVRRARRRIEGDATHFKCIAPFLLGAAQPSTAAPKQIRRPWHVKSYLVNLCRCSINTIFSYLYNLM